MNDIVDLGSDESKSKSKPIVNNLLEKLIYKIGQCIDYQSLYALEESFNKCGLTIQTTSRNRMILCKLREGRPVSESVVDDYIFVGGIDDMGRELTERATEKIADFVRTNYGSADKVQNMARVWRNGLRMYDAVSIVNEDQQRIAGEIGGDLICG